MSLRYFDNPYSDLESGEEIEIDYRLWKARIKKIVESILCRENYTQSLKDGGLYVGVAGVAYMLWHVASKFPEYKLKEKARIMALSHYQANSENRSEDLGTRLGFLLGNSGVIAINAVIAHDLGDNVSSQKFVDEFSWAVDNLMTIDPLGIGSDEMFLGRSGYLAGCLWLQRKLGRQIVPELKLFQLCDVIVESGRRFSRKVSSKSPLMYSYYETQYLGAAHGLTGILLQLLSVPNYLEHNPSAEKDIRASVNFLVSHQSFDGNFLCSMGEIKHPRPYGEELVHWCHGASGTLPLLARSYLVWRDEVYMTAAVKAANCVWRKGLLRKGPGLCHGVAGSGYVFLLMHRLTGDVKYLHRAFKFAEFMFSDQFKSARDPDNPVSLYEGWSGAVVFCSDILFPNQASFPFTEVFL